MIFCFHTDVMGEGVWKTLAELEDPELRKLVASLPETVMHSKAEAQRMSTFGLFSVGKRGRNSGVR